MSLVAPLLQLHLPRLAHWRPATASSPTETSALAGDDVVRRREFRTSVGLLAPYRLGEDRSWHQRRLRAPHPGLPVHTHF